MKAILLLLTGGSCLAALQQPWMGVVAYYTLAIWMPQAIWGWIFGSLRVSFFITMATMAGFLLASLGGKLNLSRLKDKQNYMLAIIWIMVHLSDLFSPFANAPLAPKMIPPEFILSIINKIYLFYFISVILIDDHHKYRYVLYVIIITIVYYVYWANSMYFSGRIWLFTDNGRLKGPGGIYNDENAFSMLFVMGYPYLYFMGLYFKNKFIKYFLWGMIPWLWHAIFLTASRGGLLGIAVVSLFIVYRSRSKFLGGLMMLGLIVAFLTQGGALLSRTDTTVKDSGGANLIMEEEEAIDPRVISWTVGFEMMADYPVLGVGTGRFQQAFPDYDGSFPHVAHNTFLQFGANSGVLAGILYVLLVYNVFKNYRYEIKTFDSDETDPLLSCSHDAIMASLVGFFVCALFLNLMIYELFYYTLLLALVRRRLVQQHPGRWED